MDLITLAVVGAGLVGKRHAMTILHCKGVKLTAIVDPDPTTREFAETCKVNHYESLQQLFDSESPQGVVLATPSPLHVEHGLEAVAAGCPMLVEKPLATSSTEADKLIKAANSASVPVLVGHHRRHNPVIKKARAIIEQGTLGTLQLVHGSCWLYKPDEYFDEAPWRKTAGGGPVWVNLIHDIDLIRYLCGNVTEVSARKRDSARGYENEDIAAALMVLDNGAIVTISCSDGTVAPWSWELTAAENPAYPTVSESCYLLGGSHASLSLPDLRLWENKEKRGWWEPMAAVNLTAEGGDSLHHQILHFADVIQGKAKPLISGEEGKETLRVIEAIKKAAATEQTIRL